MRRLTAEMAGIASSMRSLAAATAVVPAADEEGGAPAPNRAPLSLQAQALQPLPLPQQLPLLPAAPASPSAPARRLSPQRAATADGLPHYDANLGGQRWSGAYAEPAPASGVRHGDVVSTYVQNAGKMAPGLLARKPPAPPSPQAKRRKEDAAVPGVRGEVGSSGAIGADAGDGQARARSSHTPHARAPLLPHRHRSRTDVLRARELPL